MKARHDEYIALTEEGETPSWRQRSAHRIYKEQRESLKESNKICGFCQEHGHRVLTCPSRLQSVAKLEAINRTYKPLVKDICQDFGFGKGCLVRRWEWCHSPNSKGVKKWVPYMVVDIKQGSLDFCNLFEGFGTLITTNMITFQGSRQTIPRDVRWAIIQGVGHVEGYEWAENHWSEQGRLHPFQRHIRRQSRPPTGHDATVIAPSDDPFPDCRLFHPIESKRDKNKMFRVGKGEYYTDEPTAGFVENMHNDLEKFKGWVL